MSSFARFQVKNADQVFVPVGPETLDQLLDTSIGPYTDLGCLLFYDTRWVDARLVSQGDIRIEYDPSGRRLTFKKV